MGKYRESSHEASIGRAAANEKSMGRVATNEKVWGEQPQSKYRESSHK